MGDAVVETGRIPGARVVPGLLLLLALCVPSSSLPLPNLASGWMDGIASRLDSQMATSAAQEAAARGVLERLLPSHIFAFQFRIISKELCDGRSCFWIKNIDNLRRSGPAIKIEGTTGVELASGLHWYLKYWCGVHISWDKTGGVQVSSVPPPDLLPQVDDRGVVIKRPIPWSYYQNVVTSSYSFVWWDWKRWEKEIDWMALQGINLPLAFTGQEAIWQKVFKIWMDFFGGPAFLAWARMGNMHGWGGPLSQNWLDSQLYLQKSVLSRMRDLGMTPVLPAFSGNVPAALGKIFPSANITRLGNWNTISGDPRWCCTYLLDPSDPLFIKIGEAFIKQQMKEYGDITDIYNCDTFNENSPPSNDPAYITTLGASVYAAMSKANKNAIWLMQGWLFSSDAAFWRPQQMRALLHSVPFGKMIVLDLFADVKPIWKVSSHFYGVPYIWCMLHNFGGNIEMYGILDVIASGPLNAHESENSTMVGVGMCMEGIEQNPVVYELMSEMAFRSQEVQLKGWLKSYSKRRYGKSVPEIETAWEILYQTIYNCTDGIAVRRFSFRETITDSHSPHLWYSTEEVTKALELFLIAGDKLEGSLTYRYDLVDLTRQVLSKLGNQIYLDAVRAYAEGDVDMLTHQSQRFIELIGDIDTLLSSDDNFLLGSWLENAKTLATSQNERRQYEWNARTQVTMWFDNTDTNQSKLHDYEFEGKREFPLEEWRREWISYSNKWQAGVEQYPVKAIGNAHVIAKGLVTKYLS
ncbi:unnamed protein product [Spirodela intermedia]|uniref:Alpha-N-acetylglucosaminidase n=1 Tax=Spirodela intermedia TaxID=51605 RepID=A0A7I8J157_SPIIN|nr:unnamed protein product [Spirodela intermedia]CAA6663543.1 unnamed protein product [Spirodela intermedia]